MVLLYGTKGGDGNQGSNCLQQTKRHLIFYPKPKVNIHNPSGVYMSCWWLINRSKYEKDIFFGDYFAMQHLSCIKKCLMVYVAYLGSNMHILDQKISQNLNYSESVCLEVWKMGGILIYITRLIIWQFLIQLLEALHSVERDLELCTVIYCKEKTKLMNKVIISVGKLWRTLSLYTQQVLEPKTAKTDTFSLMA